MRLRAIREYTTAYTCDCKPLCTTTHYIVTFAHENGVVVAECDFCTKDEANMVVNAVNKRYDELGEPGEHCMEWLEDECDTAPDSVMEYSGVREAVQVEVFRRWFKVHGWFRRWALEWSGDPRSRFGQS